eukprot:m.14650 g.14650  ORF g.14650 m.14650 type:complete len:141 (-) comp6391_c0_seq1:135-557(-)
MGVPQECNRQCKKVAAKSMGVRRKYVGCEDEWRGTGGILKRTCVNKQDGSDKEFCCNQRDGKVSVAVCSDFCMQVRAGEPYDFGDYCPPGYIVAGYGPAAPNVPCDDYLSWTGPMPFVPCSASSFPGIDGTARIICVDDK